MDAYDNAVEQELERGQMRVECAWHAKLWGTERVMREAAPGHENDAASHGICDECLAMERKKEELCEECGHPIRLHGAEGCEFERGDTWVSCADGTEALMAMGPCGCTAVTLEAA